MAEELTFNRFTELVLARAYEAEQRTGRAMQDHAVSELVGDIPGVPTFWGLQAAEYLRDQRLVEGFFGDMGDPHIHLTGEGRVFVEQEKGTGLIRDYRRQDQVVVVMGDGNQVAVGHGQSVRQSGEFSKEEALELLGEVEERLQEAQLDDVARADAVADVQTAKAQLAKREPNLGIVKAALSALTGIDALADLAEKAHRLFG